MVGLHVPSGTVRNSPATIRVSGKTRRLWSNEYSVENSSSCSRRPRDLGACRILSSLVFPVFPKFIELEREAANRDVQRVTEAVNSEIENIKFTLWDYTKLG